MNKNNGNLLKDIDLRKKVFNSYENVQVVYLYYFKVKFFEYLCICVIDIVKRVGLDG